MATKKISLTKDQKAELENLRLLVGRRGLTPLMNGTLWRQALDVILAMDKLILHYRLRKVTDTKDPEIGNYHGVLPEGLPLYNFIEWLEIKADSETTSKLLEALTQIKIPCQIIEGKIRIIAYKK